MALNQQAAYQVIDPNPRQTKSQLAKAKQSTALLYKFLLGSSSSQRPPKTQRTKRETQFSCSAGCFGYFGFLGSSSTTRRLSHPSACVSRWGPGRFGHSSAKATASMPSLDPALARGPRVWRTTRLPVVVGGIRHTMKMFFGRSVGGLCQTPLNCLRPAAWEMCETQANMLCLMFRASGVMLSLAVDTYSLWLPARK